MSHYYVNNNAQTNGDHEVHEEGCKYMPTNRKDLGYHNSCKEAVREAKKTYPKADGCAFCCIPCHTS